MSTPQRHHHPHSSNLHVEYPNSEDDLDLEELGPETTLNYHSRADKKAGRTVREGGDTIALRNLRTDGLGRPRDRPRRYEAFGGRRGEEAEDLHGLLEYDDEGYKPDTAGISRIGDDTAPFAHSSASGQRQPEDKKGSGSRLVAKLGLTSLSAASISPDQEHLDRDNEEEHDPTAARHILVGQPQSSRFPPNSISNAKYTPWSFLPRTLYKEFSFFFNLYFLLVALSQIIPALRIGYLSTYVAPLAFVLAITLGKEAADDIARRKRDAEANAEPYTVLRFHDSLDPLRSKGVHWGSLLQPSRTTGKPLIHDVDDRLTAIQEEEENLIGQAESKTVSTGVSEVIKKSRDLKVGDVLKLGRDQRVPADVVVLKSYTTEAFMIPPSSSEGTTSTTEPANLVEPITDPSTKDTPTTQSSSRTSPPTDGNASSADVTAVGETFIRTDQLDGETDWKLRLASPLSQSLDISDFTRLKIIAGKPDRKVNEFIGTVELGPVGKEVEEQASKIKKNKSAGPGHDKSNGHAESDHPATQSAPLTIDNTAWANTVLASACTTLSVVVYTGPQTRQALSTAPSRSKTGLLDSEINNLTKILCAFTLALSVILVALEGFESREGQNWYISITRFLILFSTIIPISLRVNLDMGKTVYARFIERDPDIIGAVVRTSTIPEELGRVEYLLSDKTGTLTQNGTSAPSIYKVALILSQTWNYARFM